MTFANHPLRTALPVKNHPSEPEIRTCRIRFGGLAGDPARVSAAFQVSGAVSIHLTTCHAPAVDAHRLLGRRARARFGDVDLLQESAGALAQFNVILEKHEKNVT